MNLLYLHLAYLAGNLYRERLVLWIHHQRLLHVDPVVGEHLPKIAVQGFQAQPPAELVERNSVVACRHHDRSTAHEILIYRKALRVRHALRSDDHQHINVRRHLSRAQIHSPHLVLLPQ